VTGDAFTQLEAARERVLEEATAFVDKLEPILPESLRTGFERLCIRQAEHVGRMDRATRAALDDAIDHAVASGVRETAERLRSPEIWLAPLTAPDLPPRRPFGWPGWVPDWVARLLDRAGPEQVELGDVDDPSNRLWVAIAAAAKPLDPVLEEFGFRPERRRLGGGSFGIAARSLPQLDPSGALARQWRRYRSAYERLAAMTASDG
jgi:hypothetical protein